MKTSNFIYIYTSVPASSNSGSLVKWQVSKNKKYIHPKLFILNQICKNPQIWNVNGFFMKVT